MADELRFKRAAFQESVFGPIRPGNVFVFRRMVGLTCFRSVYKVKRILENEVVVERVHA